MNKEKQIAALAEFDGLKIEITSHGIIQHTRLISKGIDYGPQTEGLPDYLEDLNALHKLEEKLDDQQKITYALFLHPAKNRDYLMNDFEVAHSGPEKRAEFLLKTLKLWEND